jgi:hypothetical protein
MLSYASLQDFCAYGLSAQIDELNGCFLFSFQGSVKGLKLFRETTDALGGTSVGYFE